MIHLNIGKDIYNILSADTQIASAATICPIVIPDEIKGNYIVYQRQSTEFIGTKDYILKESDNVNLLVVTDNYNDGIDLAEKVLNALLTNDYQGTDIEGIDVVTTDESYSEGKYIQNIIVKINY